MKIPLRTINNGLSIIVLLLALYIIFMPFLPSVVFEVKQVTTATPVLDDPNTSEPIPQENILSIPSIGLRELIHDSPDASGLDKGVWRRPHTSSPLSGSNTVLVGHRFTYTSPEGVFYHLDKLKINQEMTVYWNQQKYSYIIDKIFVVPPSAVEVEAPTDSPQLTLYTCTPLWSGHERLVIQAKLKERDV